MHCAGLEISHFLPDKPQREYDLVFDVEVEGWLSLLRALRGAEIGAAVVFSSIAGRFGNAGQTDYSAANDLLMGLPTHVDGVVRFKGSDERGPLFAVVHPRDGEGVNGEVVDESGKVKVRLEGYMTTALPGGLDPEALDPIRAAMG